MGFLSQPRHVHKETFPLQEVDSIDIEEGIEKHVYTLGGSIRLLLFIKYAFSSGVLLGFSGSCGYS